MKFSATTVGTFIAGDVPWAWPALLNGIDAPQLGAVGTAVPPRSQARQGRRVNPGGSRDLERDVGDGP